MNHLEDVVVDGRIILKLILRVEEGMTWIGLSCLCRGANCELLVTKGNERWGADSWLAEKVSASQEEPRSTA